MPSQPHQAKAAGDTRLPRLLVIASSTGGLDALTRALTRLPHQLPAAIVVVHHAAPDHRNLLAGILAKRTQLRVVEARQGDRLETGTVYVARPGRHVLVAADGTLALSDAPPVHFTRPAADMLFESAAHAFGDRVAAVVLTGRGVDATAGAAAVKRFGGTVIAQDEASSKAFGMPGSAITSGSVDLVLPVDQIGDALIEWASEGVVHERN